MSPSEAFSFLGLSSSAAKEEVQTKYRELARQYHPDRGGDANRMVRLNLAYEVALENPGKVSRVASFTREELSALKKAGVQDPFSSKDEAWFTKVVKTSLEQAGALVFKIHGHAMQAPGIPDLYVAHVLWQGWIELKVNARVMPIQDHVIRELTKRGASVVVLRLVGNDAMTDTFIVPHVKQGVEFGRALLGKLSGVH